jgi:hypothetical protein
MYHVMHKTAEAPDASRYRGEISSQLWEIATNKARLGDWETARRAAVLANRLGDEPQSPFNVFMRLLGRLLVRFPPAIKRRLKIFEARVGQIPVFGLRQRR